MQTVQSLKEQAAALKKRIASAEGSADPKKLRAARKKLKRVQRRARSTEATLTRFAEKAKKKEKKAEG